MMNEEWRDIKGFEGYYQVSNMGRVRTVTRRTSVKNISRRGGPEHIEYWLRHSRILKPVYYRNKNSRQPTVHLYKDEQPRVSVMIKRLVAEAFLSDYTSDIKTHQIQLIDPNMHPCAHNLRIVKHTYNERRRTKNNSRKEE